MALMLPLSIDEISYLDERHSPVFIKEVFHREFISLYDKEGISNFLTELDIYTNYVVRVTFVPDIVNTEDDMPQLILSKPFLVNRLSSATFLKKFIDERLQLMIDLYYLDDSILVLIVRMKNLIKL